jgi:hypothetical protein
MDHSETIINNQQEHLFKNRNQQQDPRDIPSFYGGVARRSSWPSIQAHALNFHAAWARCEQML